MIRTAWRFLLSPWPERVGLLLGLALLSIGAYVFNPLRWPWESERSDSRSGSGVFSRR